MVCQSGWSQLFQILFFRRKSDKFLVDERAQREGTEASFSSDDTVQRRRLTRTLLSTRLTWLEPREEEAGRSYTTVVGIIDGAKRRASFDAANGRWRRRSPLRLAMTSGCVALSQRRVIVLARWRFGIAPIATIITHTLPLSLSHKI